MTDRGRIARWSWLGLLAPAVIAGCATQPPGGSDHPSFLLGLFHGFTALVTLAGSVFLHIRIYAFPNSGFWYDTGFVIGFAASIVLLVLIFIPRIGGFVTREGS
jgi:hypothetical protein